MGLNVFHKLLFILNSASFARNLAIANLRTFKPLEAFKILTMKC